MLQVKIDSIGLQPPKIIFDLVLDPRRTKIDMDLILFVLLFPPGYAGRRRKTYLLLFVPDQPQLVASTTLSPKPWRAYPEAPHRQPT